MEQDKRFTDLLDEATQGRLSRRSVLRRALVLGLSAPAIGALLAACGDDEGDEPAGGTGTTPAAGAATSPAGAATATTSGTGAASPTAATTGSPATTGEEMTKDNPPSVERAAEASEFSGASIVFWGDAVGPGSEADSALAAKFTEETGINVEVIPRPQSATESFSQYQRTFQGQSADMDCGMIDVIWPGAFAQHLVDLSDALADDVGRYYETIIANNTIDGKLVGIPWFGDFGMLFYRTDLLEKYEFDGPPETWDDLEEQAQAIMEGEAASNAEFTGFVFQGNAYEGLTCDALEWIASAGGGTIVEDGEVTLENEDAIAMMNRARDWVGNISPQGVTTYQEEDARNVFQSGNAAFMRNWPYAYSAGQGADSPIADMFDVAPLPAQEGSDHVGTVGGWQIAVSSYSENQEAAIEWARYITSAPVQKWRGIVYSFVPTMPEVAEDPEVIEAQPYLENLADVVRVTRPSREAGDLYNELSTEFFQGCNEILNGADAEEVLPEVAAAIEDLIG